MSRVFGIDLGTTNSLIAYSEHGVPRLIADPVTGSTLLPSIVAFPTIDDVLIGEAARLCAANHPDATITSAKRSMGVGTDRFHIHNRNYTPPEISALILGVLKHRAERVLGEAVRQVVITVPAYFNDGQRQATRDAGRLAGLEVLRLVNEPTAAALAYGLDRRDSGVIAVYDLGGGTFDISILRLQRGVFEVLATAGNTRLGGDDIDDLIVQHLLLQLPQAEHDNRIVRGRLRRSAENAKIALSEADRAEVVVALSTGEVALELTRAQLDSLAGDLVRQTLDSCRHSLHDAGLVPSDLDEVVLVGGATRMPIVRRQVEELFGRVPHTQLNPDEVVALGAAVQAGVLAGDSDVLLLDVVPLSLGIETVGGVVERIIERNTTIPATASRVFTTFVDKQTAVDVHVVQGERELANDNASLARFKLVGIDPSVAGIPRIEMTFLIDANGVLSVTARDQVTGTEHSVEVKPAYGLADAEIEKRLADAIDHAAEDAANRARIEVRRDAEALLRQVRQAVADASLPTDEAQVIAAAMVALERALPGARADHIQTLVEALNQATTPLAQRLMDKAIHTALSNKSVATVV